MAKAEGIPPTASTVVPGLSLNYVGDWVYGISGVVAIDNTEASALEGTTGSGIIVGTVQLNNPVDDDAPGSANVSTANIKFNGVSIAIISGSSTDNGTNRSVIQKVIIPPLTNVVITVDSNGNESDRFGSLLLTGRVYGANE